MAEFKMPALGSDMDAGTLLEWRVRPGDSVHRGDIVAVVDTEKSAIEIEIFLDGVVTELVVEPGQKVPVGAVLAHVRTASEPLAATPEPPPERTRASPAARRRARELGIDLATIAGSGPHGTIGLSDVDAAAAGSKSAAAPAAEGGATAEPDRKARLRHAIAVAMARSNREIPHYHIATTIPMARSLAWLERANAGREVSEQVLPAALFVKAVALAARETPALNGFWRDERLVMSCDIHVGMVVSLRGGGVIVPALHHADRHGIRRLMAMLSDVVSRGRAGNLRSSELADGTITVTALGERAPELVFGVVFPPQIAIVGFGGIVERPWIVDGKVVAMPVVSATLAADHRASDGHLGARFLTLVEQKLQEPESLDQEVPP
jgi:pyruvate dehydrogenase E2 component (dihydrolipoamide acetyltransferase)